MIKKINEAELLELAKTEEKNYNWEKSANLYEQVTKSFLKKNLLEDAAKIYKRLGYVNAKASETADTSVDYVKLKSSAIIAYEKAGNLFKQLRNEPNELECEAETSYLKGILTKSLIEAERYAQESKVEISIPEPFDGQNRNCGSFWTRFQVWPVKGIDPKRYSENVIIGGCNAVVRGHLKSLGYFFDYNNIMELWNNDKFQTIRRNLLKGVYPDLECKTCQSYAGLKDG